jgi:hypothetical protein
VAHVTTRPPTGAAAIAAILAATPDLFDRHEGVARHAAQTIDPILRAAPASLSSALDRAFRDARLHRQLGLNFIDVEPVQLARLERLGPLRCAALAIGSMVRSGHVRQAAVHHLCASDDPLALPFLLNRLNDYVGTIASLAWTGIERRLRPEHAPLFVHSLPLLDRMTTWVRAGSVQRERLRQLLLLPHPTCRQALWDGLHARDSEVCRHSAALLAVIHRGQPELQQVLAAALTARDPRTRRWAARLAIDEQFTPREVLLALTPQLERDRSPAIRAAGLHGRTLQRHRDGIVRATFDTHASVRYRARVVLAELFEPLDYRSIALATLAAADAPREALLAALATLTDFGRVDDIPGVAAYTHDARPTVAREARRTLAALQRI